MEKSYNQKGGISYEEKYTHVTLLEAIHLVFVFACWLNFKLNQIDVKSAFLNGFIIG